MPGLTRFLREEAELVYGSKDRPDRPKMQDDSDGSVGYVDMLIAATFALVLWVLPLIFFLT